MSFRIVACRTRLRPSVGLNRFCEVPKLLSLQRLPYLNLKTMSSQNLDLHKAKVEKSMPLEDKDAKWLGLRKIQWVDPTGKTRYWDCAVRKTRNGDVDVSQFRPPVGKVILELPAGLVDAGEESEEGTKKAALRELSEETGYGENDDSHSVEVSFLSGLQFNDPGLSNATMKLCTVEIRLAKDAPDPVAHPDEGEHIERHLVPLRRLSEELDGTLLG